MKFKKLIAEAKEVIDTGDKVTLDALDPAIMKKASKLSKKFGTSINDAKDSFFELMKIKELKFSKGARKKKALAVQTGFQKLSQAWQEFTQIM